MKYLPIKSTQFGLIGAKVDDDVYERLKHLEYDTTEKGYPRRHIGDAVYIYLHHDVMGLPEPGIECHHIDEDVLNAQRSNLIWLTKAQHRQVRSRSASGFLGVSWHSITGKWRAVISKDGIYYSCGLYHRAEDAAQAYDSKAKELYKDKATLNFPDNAKN